MRAGGSKKRNCRRGKRAFFNLTGVGICLLLLFGCTRQTDQNETKPAAETSAVESQTEKPTEPTSETIEPFPETIGKGENEAEKQEEPEGLKIIVATDMHYLARELTDQGSEFVEMVEHGDGKVTNYIWQIVEAFTNEVIEEQPDLLLLTGDLSLDGEYRSHEEFAGYLRRIEAEGIPVAVIPGNHDINNVGASRFYQAKRVPAEPTSPEQFCEIYGEFGYDEAISRDTESLSYVYPISDSVWGLMLDSCQYKNGRLTGGMIDTETFGWIERQLDKAYEAGVMILPVSHHNLLEQSKIYQDDCTIEHSEQLTELLVGWEATLYLSGHLHVQHYDNSDPEPDGETGIYEIVTSSLATPPCQYGILYFQDNGYFQYHTKSVDVDRWAKENGETDPNLLHFSQYRTPFLEQVFYNQAYDKLSLMRGLELTKDQIDGMCQMYAQANCYYYWGRAVEIARELHDSQEYKLWMDYAGTSLQAEYLDYILEEGTRDYNYLEWP